MRTRILLIGVLAGLLVATPAGAFTPPELFIRQMSMGQPASDWIPLASPPALGWIGGYQIGFRLQPSAEGNNFQTVALTYTGVPDGQVTQPLTTPPYCIGRAGTPGTIQSVDEIPIQYEGNGTYSVAVTLGPGPAQDGCFGASGKTTTASFGVDVHVAPQLVGDPYAFRAKPLPGNPFAGIVAADPPGGYGDSTCALDGAVAPDGSVSGRLVIPEDAPPPRGRIATFPEPGTWLCVARGVVEGQVPDTFGSAFFGTPWSAPLAVDVHSDFQRKGSAIERPRSSRPTLEVTAQFAASAGGRVTVRLQRLVRCKRRGGYLFKKVASSRSTFDARGVARLRLKRPRKIGYYAGVVSFGGTRYVRPGTDPLLIALGATKRSIRFVRPQAYPRC